MGTRARRILEGVCGEICDVLFAPIIADIQACATGGGQVVHRWKDEIKPADLKSEISTILGKTYASKK